MLRFVKGLFVCFLVSASVFACGGSEKSEENERRSDPTVVEKISEQERDNQSQVETPTSIPPTPSSSILEGPYGINITDGLDTLDILGECFELADTFQTELLLPAANLTIDAVSLNEVGFIWEFFRDELIGTPEILAGLFLCEERYPKVFKNVYSDQLANMLGSCAVIDNFSTQRALDRCLDDTDSLSQGIDQITDRIWEINFWLQDVLDQYDLDN